MGSKSYRVSIAVDRASTVYLRFTDQPNRCNIHPFARSTDLTDRANDGGVRRELGKPIEKLRVGIVEFKIIGEKLFNPRVRNRCSKI